MLASILRASCVTLSSWKSAAAQLRDRASLDASCVVFPAAVLGAVSEPHWDSPPIALTLESASHGFSHDTVFGPLCGDVLKETRLAEQELIRVFPRRRFKFQNVLYRNLFLIMYPDDLETTIVKRFSKHFPSFVPQLTPALFLELRAFACSFPPCFPNNC